MGTAAASTPATATAPAPTAAVRCICARVRALRQDHGAPAVLAVPLDVLLQRRVPARRLAAPQDRVPPSSLCSKAIIIIIFLTLWQLWLWWSWKR